MKPILYARIELYDLSPRPGDPPYSNGPGPNRPPVEDYSPRSGDLFFPQLRPLVRTVLADKSIANSVQHFTVRNAPTIGLLTRGHWKTKQRQKNRYVKVDEVVRAAVEDLTDSSEDYQTWIKQLSWADHADGLFALLISSLPCLVSIDLMLLSKISEYLGPMLATSFIKGRLLLRHNAVLPQLTDFMHAASDADNGLMQEWIGWCLKRPSVRRVFAHRLRAFRGRSHESKVWLNLRPRSSNVTHLEFRDSMLSSRETKVILRAPKNLRTFIYEIGGGGNGVAPEHFNADLKCPSKQSFHNMWTGLRAHKKTLEDLWLDYDHRFEIKFKVRGLGQDCHPLSLPLRGFQSLKRLKIAADFLFGFEGIQSNREKLVRVGDKQPRTQDSNIAGLKHTWMPALLVNKPLHADYLIERLPRCLQSLHILHCKYHLSNIVWTLERLLAERSLSTSDSSTAACEEILFPQLRKIVLSGSFLSQDARPSWSAISTFYSLASSQGIDFRTMESDKVFELELLPYALTQSAFSYHRSEERGWGMDGEIKWADCRERMNCQPKEVEVRLPLTPEARKFWDEEEALSKKLREERMNEIILNIHELRSRQKPPPIRRRNSVARAIVRQLTGDILDV